VKRDEWVSRSDIARVGDHYETCAVGGENAETYFRVARRTQTHTWVDAKPKTGRTHQIRVHMASEGLPILGDALYGGSTSPRVCLHAAEIKFIHPAADLLRAAIADPADTDCLRLRHGASDSTPDFYADRVGDWLLAQGKIDLTDRDDSALLRNAARPHGLRGIYFKRLKHISTGTTGELSPQHVTGEVAPEIILVRENGVTYELSFREGYSVGLFLDQRDNRRRLLTRHLAADFPQLPTPNSQLLNCFAYTCAFSVCAALAGAHTTSLDLSKKYLEWGKRNFAHNGLDPAAHDFIFGDTFDWLHRFKKKGRAFDTILLDPPTFSRSKESGVWQAERDYGKLITAALPVLKPNGILLASTNAATLAPEKFLEMLTAAVRGAGRKILHQHYVPQPPDFPISRAEPAYLKTVWLRIA
jgi:23S rRNA (cytosine1962-C5)-methyltransferase